MRALLFLALVLAGCEREPVRCTGARPLACYCAIACEATDAGATVVHPEDCEPLCVDASDGGVP
mgnify:FL=1